MEPKTSIDDYLQPLNDQLIKENKKIFLGDFNFDLLQADSNDTLNFLDTLMASHIIPTITIFLSCTKR